MGTDRSAHNNRTSKQGQTTREKARAQRRAERPQRDPADWTSVDGPLLCSVLAAVAAQDAALRLGLSRDGGAFAIGIYGDGEPYTEYVGSGEDINDYLRKLGEYFAIEGG